MMEVDSRTPAEVVGGVIVPGDRRLPAGNRALDVSEHVLIALADPLDRGLDGIMATLE